MISQFGETVRIFNLDRSLYIYKCFSLFRPYFVREAWTCGQNIWSCEKKGLVEFFLYFFIFSICIVFILLALSAHLNCTTNSDAATTMWSSPYSHTARQIISARYSIGLLKTDHAQKGKLSRWPRGKPHILQCYSVHSLISEKLRPRLFGEYAVSTRQHALAGT